MTQEELEIEQVEQYLAGTLTKEEHDTFVQKMAEDKGFAERISQYSMLMKGIDETGRLDFMQKMESWEEEISKKGKSDSTRIIPLKKYFAWAAGFLLPIIGLTYFFIFSPKNNQTNEELFIAYYSPYENFLNNRSDNSPESLINGLNAYDLGNFEDAIVYLKSYLTTNTEENGAKFYLGISYLENSNVAESISIFKELENTNTPFNDVSAWYLALAYLAKDDREKSALQLKKIVQNPRHEFYEKAEELIQFLD